MSIKEFRNAQQNREHCISSSKKDWDMHSVELGEWSFGNMSNDDSANDVAKSQSDKEQKQDKMVVKKIRRIVEPQYHGCQRRIKRSGVKVGVNHGFVFFAASFGNIAETNNNDGEESHDDGNNNQLAKADARKKIGNSSRKRQTFTDLVQPDFGAYY